MYNFFFRTPKLQNKKFATSEISNKKFRKIHYFANIKYEGNSRKYCEKNLSRNIFVKRKIFTKKKFVEKNFHKKLQKLFWQFFYI